MKITFLKNYLERIRKSKNVLHKIGLIIAGLFLLGVLTVGLLIAIISISLPDVRDLEKLSVPQSTTIYDREGNILYVKHGGENREYVEIDEISKYVIDATIAIEDDKFFEHPGFNAKGILRAFITNTFNLKLAQQGGSTITQQYIKQTFLTPKKSYIRKLKELILAIQLEQAFDKNHILELYLNKIPYGNNAYGIEKAAQTYFNKSAKDLNLTESAIIASIPKAPTYYNPYGPHHFSILSDKFKPPLFGTIETEGDLEDDEFLRGLIGTEVNIDDENKVYIQGRSDLVLRRMQELGYINEEERTQSLEEIQKIEFINNSTEIKAAHFVFYILEQLEDKYGQEIVEQGGLQVYTTIDPKMQEAAKKAVDDQAKTNVDRFNATNASLVSIDPKNGQILAMIGSKNYFDKEIDGNTNAAMSYRQPGSSFKPFVYSQLFTKGFGPGSPVFDTPIKFGNGDEPKNFNDQFNGAMTIRSALGQSRNIPAIKAYYAAGEQKPIMELAEKMGINVDPKINYDPNVHYGWPVALGAIEVRLFDMVSAFGVFANGGVRSEPVSILRIETPNGTVLEKWEEKEGKEVLDPQVAFMINSILSDESVRLGPNLTLSGKINAAKTGTSNRQENGKYFPHDLWAMGYTPKLVTGVWVGNNDIRKHGKLTLAADGYNAAAPIWKNFMTEALKNSPSENFKVPKGIKKVSISKASGKLPGPETPESEIISDLFASFSIPTETDDSFTQVKIDTSTMELATEFCPEHLVKTITYRKITDLTDRADWLKSASDWIQKGTTDQIIKTEGIVIGNPPGGSCHVHNANTASDIPEVNITSPTPSDSIEAGAKTLKVEIDVSSQEEIDYVEFYLDGKLQNKTAKLPYVGNVRFAGGSAKSGERYSIRAVAYNKYGYTGEDSIQVEVEN